MLRRIGPYDLLEPLGQGGGGTVFRAQHSDSGQFVALKTVRLVHSGHLHSLRREIHALARLRHPQIVGIFDEGLHEGLPWYVMDLLEGMTFKQFVSTHSGSMPNMELPWWTKSLHASTGETSAFSSSHTVHSHSQSGVTVCSVSWQQSLRVIHSLCTPLAFLHGEGIIHRDLKPDNILLRSDTLMPILVDFGLVSHFGGGSLGREKLEQSGVLTGTVPYMSPEQIRGDLVDARSDLYSLGCILYELICGRPPFVAEDLRQVLRQHLSQAPLKPSRFRPDLPPEMDALLSRLLAKQPRDRLGHATDLASALERLGVEPIEIEGCPEPRAYLYRPSFTGRVKQLDQVEQALHGLQENQGTLVLVGGESGVGKTRFLMELEKRARLGGTRVLLGECPPPMQSGSPSEIGAPLQAFRKVMVAIADRCRERGPDEAKRLLGLRAQVFASYEPSLSGIPGLEDQEPPAELPAAAARSRLMSYLLETFSALCGEESDSPEPHLLLLDDLQWADPLSFAFLEQLLRANQQRRLPLVLVASYRSEEVGSSLQRLLQVAAEGGGLLLQLDRLEEQSVSVMVGDLLALDPPPKTFSHFLARHSEGNPFFIAEYLRLAVEERLLYRDESGNWCVGVNEEGTGTDQVYERLPLPVSLRELVGRRFERLSPPALELLQAAAILGRESDAALLAKMVQIESLAGLEALTELLERQVLEEPLPRLLRFTHDKLREVAHEQILPEQQLGLHRSAAEALETLPESQKSQWRGDLAHHWEQAGDLDRASERYFEAAQEAMNVYALPQAERFYRAFLQLERASKVALIEARMKLATGILLLDGRLSEGESELNQALVQAQRLGDNRLEGRVSSSLAGIMVLQGRSAHAKELSLRAMQMSRAAKDKEWEARSIINLLSSANFTADSNEPKRFFRRSQNLLRDIDNKSIQGHIWNNFGIYLQKFGKYKSSKRYLAKSLAVCRQTNDMPGQASALANLGMISFCLEDVANSKRYFEDSLALSRKIGYRRIEAHCLCELGNLLHFDGKCEEAKKHYHLALKIILEIENPVLLASTQLYLATVLRQTGESLDIVAEQIQMASQILVKMKHLMIEARWAVQNGHLKLARGLDAEADLQSAEEKRQMLPMEPGGELEIQVGSLERACGAFRRGEPLFRGQCIEDLPIGVRRWLVGQGHRSAAQASLEKQ